MNKQGHGTIRNKLAVDPEAAAVIRRIFDEALTGRNTSQIARGLNDDGIPTPGQYFRQKHPDKKKFSKMSDKICWEAVMVYKVIRNEVYTGTLISHKMKSCGVGSRKQKVCDPIIVEGTHEAIVTKEEFTLAQNCIRRGEKNPSRKQNNYPLKGLVRCGNCKRAMSRRKLQGGAYHYQCTHSTHDQNTQYKAYVCNRYASGGKNACASHYINQKTLIHIVLTDIRCKAMWAQNDRETLRELLLARERSLPAWNAPRLCKRK